MKRHVVRLAFGVLCVLHGNAQGQFATSVISYERGTGYAANFTNSATVLGAPASGSSVTPFAPPFSTTQIVSIGAGGWLSVQLEIRIEVLSGRTQVDAISVVPEPSNWVLGAVGGAIWWAVQRRRSHS